MSARAQSSSARILSVTDFSQRDLTETGTSPFRVPMTNSPDPTTAVAAALWRRLGAIAALVTAVGIALASCSSGGLPVKLSGANYAATASGVSCAPSSGSVKVSGTFTAVGPASAIGPSATIYDSAGNQIGRGEGPLTLVNASQSAPFNFTVTVNGSPASCDVTWGAGPPPGL
jgi:hypothetical protein